MTTETPPRHRDHNLPRRHPPGQRSRTPGSDIKRELVAAADAVLVRDGPGGVTVRAVAAQAGIAPMSVYNRLGGKDGLVDALLIRVLPVNPAEREERHAFAAAVRGVDGQLRPQSVTARTAQPDNGTPNTCC